MAKKRKLIIQQSDSEESDVVNLSDEDEIDDDEPFIDRTYNDEEEENNEIRNKNEQENIQIENTRNVQAKFINKQRTLTLCSRGINYRDRHLVSDLRDLMPHSKKDVKFDSKDKLSIITEIAESKNCNNVIFFEARKHKDLYLWLAKCPEGPSVKFLIQNIHTMDELKLTGNCLRGARPILHFDAQFDNSPHWKLLKEMIIQIFGSPKGHPKTKPFVDHVFSWFITDNRIFFRNYQIVYDDVTKEKNSSDPILVEIGPRMVLNPIRIFSNCFGGQTLYENNGIFHIKFIYLF